MQVKTKFSDPNAPIKSQIDWKIIEAKISGADFSMSDIEVPSHWSDNAANIFAQKYLRKAGVPNITQPIVDGARLPNWLYRSEPSRVPKTAYGPETSAHSVFHRLAGHWTYTGFIAGYFDREEDARNFYNEIYFMLANQIAAPNSPQWFNTGLWWAYGITGDNTGLWTTAPTGGTPIQAGNSYEFPQVHACFINSLNDNLVEEGGIYDLLSREARIFKFGSGAGSNFSVLRGKGEPLSGGGKSSGLMSWLEIFDRSAGAIHSGGTTRRAAKMVIVDVDHPDIESFIDWKVGEEYKAAAMSVGSRIISSTPTTDVELANLIPDAIFDRKHENFPMPELSIAWEGEAIRTISAQNANNSVRISNSFMDSLENDLEIDLINRVGETLNKKISSTYLWTKICRAAWACADPGLQFHDTINTWHTCKEDGPIVASNPCSEYMFLDDTACNLASLNLNKFFNFEKQTFKVEEFEYATRLWTAVLDISSQMAGSPDEKIARGNFNYRTLGLGYCGVGDILLKLGISYDSDKGRNLIAAITSLMTAGAYATSTDLAKDFSPFPRWEANATSMRDVMALHREANHKLKKDLLTREILPAAEKLWGRNVHSPGFRNAQVSLIAPTGTISLLMDASSGIEPWFALVVGKSLAGGGELTLENPQVLKTALGSLQTLDENGINLALEHISKQGEVSNLSSLSQAERDVFLCAVPPSGPALRPEAHVLMVAAVQPFLSGAVSKTANMPADSTVEDVSRIYKLAYTSGVKAIAIYRDKSKLTQPLAGGISAARAPLRAPARPLQPANHLPPLSPAPSHRRKLPDFRTGYTQKVKIDGQNLYLRTGEYEDGTLGEIFVSLSRTGSTLRALGDGFAMAVSIGLQYGVPLDTYLRTFQNTRFEPAGLVLGHDGIKLCASIFDYIFRDLGIHYLQRRDLANNQIFPIGSPGPTLRPETLFSGETCGECGSPNVRISGICKVCRNCGWTTGC